MLDDLEHDGDRVLEALLRDRWSGCLERWPKAALFQPARSFSSLAQCGILRYERYVDESQKKYEFADHDRCVFLEPIDLLSLILSAGLQDRCSASIRLCWAGDAIHDEQLARMLPLIVAAGSPVEQALIFSRMVISSRHKSLILPLFYSAYTAALLAGATHAWMGTRPALSKLFCRIGWVDTGSRIVDPVAGVLHVHHVPISHRASLVAAAQQLILQVEETANKVGELCDE